MKIQYLLILSLLCTLTSTFDLLGNWTLKQITDYPTITENVDLTIQDMIFRDTEVQQKITFEACESYKYLSEVINNNIYINIRTFYQNNYTTQNKTCSKDIISMHNFIQNKLKQIFTFKIFGNILVFLDAKKTIQFRFERKIIVKSTNLKGQWNIVRLNSKKVEDIVFITDSQIILCQNRMRFNYTIRNKYQLKTGLSVNNQCSFLQLLQTVKSISYFRVNNATIDFYDSNLTLRIEFTYNKELASNFNNSIILSNNNAFLSPLLKANVIGKWQPLSVFGLQIQSKNIMVNITENKIIYSGGCNIVSFDYLFDDSKKVFNIGQKKSTSNVCKNDSDGIYINAIWKITKYSMTDNSGILLLTDAIGKPLFELQNLNRNNLTSSSQPFLRSNSTILSNFSQNSSLSVSQWISFTNGRYVFQLINRRDLPRVLCNVTENRITFQGCNTMELSYNIFNKTQINIRGFIKGNTKCAINNDDFILNTFNSVKFIVKNTALLGSNYYFKDSTNQTVINLGSF